MATEPPLIRRRHLHPRLGAHPASPLRLPRPRLLQQRREARARGAPVPPLADLQGRCRLGLRLPRGLEGREPERALVGHVRSEARRQHTASRLRPALSDRVRAADRLRRQSARLRTRLRALLARSASRGVVRQGGVGAQGRRRSERGANPARHQSWTERLRRQAGGHPPPTAATTAT